MIGSNEWSWLRTGAALLSSACTLVAVITALWLQYFLVYHRRARLALVFDPHPNASYTATYGAYHESLWIRLRVENRSPARESAEDVQLFVVNVRRPAGSTRRGPVPARPFKFADVDSDRIDLPPGVFRYVDIGHILRGAEPNDVAHQRLRLVLYPINIMDDPEGTPNDDRHRLEPGVYALELVLTARSTPAQFYVLYVGFEASWADDPFGLAVQAGLASGRFSEGSAVPPLLGPTLA